MPGRSPGSPNRWVAFRIARVGEQAGHRRSGRVFAERVVNLAGRRFGRDAVAEDAIVALCGAVDRGRAAGLGKTPVADQPGLALPVSVWLYCGDLAGGARCSTPTSSIAPWNRAVVTLPWPPILRVVERRMCIANAATAGETCTCVPFRRSSPTPLS